MEIIKIPKELSLQVEKLGFEYKAKMRVLRYLIDNLLEEHKELIEQFKEEAEQKWIELNLCMNEIIKLYPSQEGHNYYTFDYENNSLNYYDKIEDNKQW